MKTFKILLVAIIATLFIGCGGSGGSDSNSTLVVVNNDVNYTVVDDYILDALVTDANGSTAKMIAPGVYQFPGGKRGVEPITVQGGFYDVNKDGITSFGDKRFDINMTSYGNGLVISPLTTLLSKGFDKEVLSSSFEISEFDLYSDHIKEDNVNAAIANQYAYWALKENKLTQSVLDEYGTAGNISYTLEKLKEYGGFSSNANDSFDIMKNTNYTSSSNVEESILTQKNLNDAIEQLEGGGDSSSSEDESSSEGSGASASDDENISNEELVYSTNYTISADSNETHLIVSHYESNTTINLSSEVSADKIIQVPFLNPNSDSLKAVIHFSIDENASAWTKGHEGEFGTNQTINVWTGFNSLYLLNDNLFLRYSVQDDSNKTVAYLKIKAKGD